MLSVGVVLKTVLLHSKWQRRLRETYSRRHPRTKMYAHVSYVPDMRPWQAFSATCLVHGTFYGELVFKTITPLGVAVVIMGVRTFLRSSWITDGRTWRGRSMKCNECLLALTYFVLTPAINAALRTLSCEVYTSLDLLDKNRVLIATNPGLVPSVFMSRRELRRIPADKRRLSFELTAPSLAQPCILRPVVVR